MSKSIESEVGGATSEAARVAELFERVQRMARALARRLPDHLEVDELVGAGALGLADALARTTVHEGAEFEAYAVQRIRGAMLDELRRLDVLTRGERALARRMDAVTRRLATALGRMPDADEVAEAMGTEQEEIERCRTAREQRRFRPVDTVGVCETEDESVNLADRATPSPEDIAHMARLGRRAEAALGELPERERVVMELTVAAELKLDDVGKQLGVTASRVCQIRNAAIARMRIACGPVASAA